MKNEVRIVGDVAEIVLSCGRVGLIDARDVPAIADFRWRASGKDFPSYVVSSYGGKQFKLCTWLLRPPPQLVVDHISGDCFDNRRRNLRLCTQAQNAKNRGRHKPRIQPKGVEIVSTTSFVAKIMSNGVTHRLGKFDSAELAARAYDAAARRLHGEFARTNFDDPLSLFRSDVAA